VFIGHELTMTTTKAAAHRRSLAQRPVADFQAEYRPHPHHRIEEEGFR
jgi:hypothetical protein